MKNCDRGLENAARGRILSAFEILSHCELAGRNRSVSGQDRKFRPLPEPIRLQDLENSARSQAKKKIIYYMAHKNNSKTRKPFSSCHSSVNRTNQAN